MSRMKVPSKQQRMPLYSNIDIISTLAIHEKERFLEPEEMAVIYSFVSELTGKSVSELAEEVQEFEPFDPCSEEIK